MRGFRLLGLVLIVLPTLLGARCGGQSTRLTQPVAVLAVTPPTCGGGPGVAPTTMIGNEVTLANLINANRVGRGLAALPQNTINVGVARFHAQDMSNNDATSIVASDGEDALRRIVCSGGTPNRLTGVIAIGYSTDPGEVFSALVQSSGASAVLFSSGLNTSLSVGNSDGYWMIIQQ